jgi:hypothetical protein
VQRHPNFFIVGAPKSGTTALAEYLRGHPDILMSDPKEPFFWCDDIPGLRARSRIDTYGRYLDLFSAGRQRYTAIGEASTLYLFSKVAVANIIARYPDAKMLVMLRDPVALVYSFHMTLLYYFVEDVREFEAAWGLQALRAQGQQLPQGCTTPELLQYQAVGRLGEQLQRLLALVPAEQVKLIFFDDFSRNPRQAYREVLKFLNVADDGRKEFPKVNAAMSPRWPALTRLLQTYPVERASRYAKSLLPMGLAEVLKTAKHTLMLKRTTRTKLAHEFGQTLRQEFAADIERLEALTQRDLPQWRGTPGA